MDQRDDINVCGLWFLSARDHLLLTKNDVGVILVEFGAYPMIGFLSGLPCEHGRSLP